MKLKRFCVLAIQVIVGVILTKRGKCYYVQISHSSVPQSNVVCVQFLVAVVVLLLHL